MCKYHDIQFSKYSESCLIFDRKKLVFSHSAPDCLAPKPWHRSSETYAILHALERTKKNWISKKNKEHIWDHVWHTYTYTQCLYLKTVINVCFDVFRTGKDCANLFFISAISLVHITTSYIICSRARIRLRV